VACLIGISLSYFLAGAVFWLDQGFEAGAFDAGMVIRIPKTLGVLLVYV
jgi:hypothetical protein